MSPITLVVTVLRAPIYRFATRATVDPKCTRQTRVVVHVPLDTRVRVLNG